MIKLFICVFTFCIKLSIQTTFFVSQSEGKDSQNGSKSNPFKTIQKGCDSASPGDTIYVKQGIYKEKIEISISGQEGSQIILQNFEREKVIISGKDISKNNTDRDTDDIIYMKNIDYFTIQGFEIRDINSKEGSGVRLIGKSTGVRILDNKIHEIRGGAEDGGAMGITIYGTNNDYPISDIIIDGNEIYDCDPAWSEALTLNGNIEYFEVTNNIIHDVNNIGIDFIGGEEWISTQLIRNGICHGNIVYNARAEYEDSAAAGIYVDGGYNITISENEVYNCNYGIEIGAENAGIEVFDVIVKKNFIHDNDKAGLLFGGFSEEVGRVKNCIFTENMLQNNDQKGDYVGELLIQWATDNEISNNKFSPTSQNIMMYSEQGNVNNEMKNNEYCSSDVKNAEWVWISQTYTGLKQFQENTQQGVGSTTQTSKCYIDTNIDKNKKNGSIVIRIFQANWGVFIVAMIVFLV